VFYSYGVVFQIKCTAKSIDICRISYSPTTYIRNDYGVWHATITYIRYLGIRTHTMVKFDSVSVVTDSVLVFT